MALIFDARRRWATEKFPRGLCRWKPSCSLPPPPPAQRVLRRGSEHSEDLGLRRVSKREVYRLLPSLLTDEKREGACQQSL